MSANQGAPVTERQYATPQQLEVMFGLGPRYWRDLCRDGSVHYYRSSPSPKGVYLINVASVREHLARVTELADAS